MIEEILRQLELEDGIKISDAEILFVDDEEKELLKVGDRFPGAKLVKAP
jgi:predicted phosphatase